MNSFPWRLRVAWRVTARMTPWLRSSQERYFESLEGLIRPQSRILDIGCGKEFLVSWMRPDKYLRWSASILDEAVIFGVDPCISSLRQNTSRLTACATVDHLPFQADSFDVVTANMVVEHLAEPEPALREIFRVLKPGGVFLFHTPNLRAPEVGLSNLLPYAFKRRVLVPVFEGGRQEDDVFRTHYRLNTKATIVSAAACSGFLVEGINHVFTSPFTQMLGPFVVFELLRIRLLSGERFESWRPDLVCLLRKPAT